MADLPFASFPTRNEALANSVRLMQEGGAAMVKLESGAGQIEIVEFLANHDIAVCAHLGLKPQSVHKTGGFRVQGRESEAAERMVADAKALESAGADVMLLECIPSELGSRITQELQVPVIGIGAGPDTHGQILVLYDVLDITTGRKPRFVMNCMDGTGSNLEGLKRYVRAVKDGSYPAPEHCFYLTPVTGSPCRFSNTSAPCAHRFAIGSALACASPSCRPWAIFTRVTSA